LAKEGTWTVDRVGPEADEFLHRFTIETYYEKGRDRFGMFPDGMIELRGILRPDVEQMLYRSDEWRQFEDYLLAVAEQVASSTHSSDQTTPFVAQSVPQARSVLRSETSIPGQAYGRDGGAGAPTTEVPAALKIPKTGKRRGRQPNPASKRNAKYEAIDSALHEISEARPKNHEEVFRFLDERNVPLPRRKLFKAAGGWLRGFQQNPPGASAWLSQAWGRLGLPPFARGPKK
jgi:hypothetical protein